MQIPYSSPVPVAMYPTYGLSLLFLGLLIMAGYFVYQMRGHGKRNLVVELSIGALSSVALGFGTLFMMMCFGLYI